MQEMAEELFGKSQRSLYSFVFSPSTRERRGEEAYCVCAFSLSWMRKEGGGGGKRKKKGISRPKNRGMVGICLDPVYLSPPLSYPPPLKREKKGILDTFPLPLLSEIEIGCHPTTFSLPLLSAVDTLQWNGKERGRGWVWYYIHVQWGLFPKCRGKGLFSSTFSHVWQETYAACECHFWKRGRENPIWPLKKRDGERIGWAFLFL